VAEPERRASHDPSRISETVNITARPSRLRTRSRERHWLSKVPRRAASERWSVGCLVEHLTTDQKVRGSNPFGRATSYDLWPAQTRVRRLSRFVHCGPVVLLWCSYVSELFVPGRAAACCSAWPRPDLDGFRGAVAAVDPPLAAPDSPPGWDRPDAGRAGSWSPSWAGSPAAVGDRIGARPWPGRVAWRWLPACPCKTPTPGRFARLATSPELRWRPPGEGRPVTVAMGCPSHARVVRPAREGAVV
jgi:hypothetical protein